MLFPAGLLILMAIKFGWSHKSICPIRIQSRMQMYTFRVEMVNFTGGLSFSTRRLTKEIQSTQTRPPSFIVDNRNISFPYSLYRWH